MKLTLCPIDFETTGKEPKLCRPTELGAAILVLKHTELDENTEFWTQTVLANVSKLIYAPDYEPLSEEVLEVCPHITDALLKTEGIPFVDAIKDLLAMFHYAGWPDYMIAHNAEFDEEVFRSEMGRHREQLKAELDDETLQRLWALRWICSIRDIQYNPRFTCKKLAHLALDHGIKMDGRTLHKAIDDVLLLVDLLDAANVKWNHVIEQFNIPFVIVKAIIPSPFGKGNDGGKGKDACKAAKFKWQDIGDFNLPNSWLKKLKQDQVEVEASALGYPLHIVKTL